MSETREFRALLDEAKAKLDLYGLWEVLGVPGNPRRNPTLSPFRQEKSPSFSIFANGQKWKDQGSQTTGDQIDFLMEWEKIDAKTARERFFALCGMDGATWTPEDEATAQARRNEREQARQEKEQAERYAGMAADLMPGILTDYAYEEVDWWEASRWRLENQPIREQQDVFLSALFAPDDVIWMGETKDSGDGKEGQEPEFRQRIRQRNAAHFRPVRDWLQAPELPGPMICPHVLQPGIHSRTAANVTASPWLVCDIDSPLSFLCETKQAQCKCLRCKPTTPEGVKQNIAAGLSVTYWLVARLKLDLHAIVYSGNRSVHSWFSTPPPDELADLRTIAPSLGIDTALFHPPQTCRMPGFRHEKSQAFARLLYLNL